MKGVIYCSLHAQTAKQMENAIKTQGFFLFIFLNLKRMKKRLAHVGRIKTLYSFDPLFNFSYFFYLSYIQYVSIWLFLKLSSNDP